MTQPPEVQELQKRVISFALTGAVCIAVLFLFLGQRPIAKGLVLGTCFSIINFVLLGKSLPMVMGKSRAKASALGFISMLGRFGVLAVPVVIGLKRPGFDIFAVIVGLFAVQIMILLDHVVLKRIQRSSPGSVSGQ